jgi:hypothetical protein
VKFPPTHECERVHSQEHLPRIHPTWRAGISGFNFHCALWRDNTATIKGCIIRQPNYTARRLMRTDTPSPTLCVCVLQRRVRVRASAGTNSCHKTAALINDVTESLAHGESNYLMSAHDVPIKLVQSQSRFAACDVCNRLSN